jgi:hypothetical protein
MIVESEWVECASEDMSDEGIITAVVYMDPWTNDVIRLL